MKFLIKILILFTAIPTTVLAQKSLPKLKVSANHRFLMDETGKPFFWLGDTGWLLFVKCKKEEAIQYLDTRKQQGFNVIQVMLLHQLGVKDAYGDPALIKRNIAQPNVMNMEAPGSRTKYDYWDNVDFIVREAAKRGIYVALVPLWGNNVKDGKISVKQAAVYATFLANRYKDFTNIIWLDGGDIKGSEGLEVWQTIGKTLRSIDKNHLITFHPRGRTSSSTWFHNESWLDFNMFQSGHRSYAQDTSADEALHYGEDNWKYVAYDYQLKPTKPTIDGEPSYEDIPYGLHTATEPYWQDYEVRRYAYWSVFAGGFGFTYGHNSVMQFYKPADSGTSFFPKVSWQDGLKAPGALQMKYLKQLILSKSYFDRVPDQSMVADNGEKYERVLATRGSNYALFYTYNGRDFKVVMGKIGGKKVNAYWYSPKDGTKKPAGTVANKGTLSFDPPGDKQNGNDWVLVLESA